MLDTLKKEKNDASVVSSIKTNFGCCSDPHAAQVIYSKKYTFTAQNSYTTWNTCKPKKS